MPDPVTVAVITTGAPTVDVEGLTWSVVVVSKTSASALGLTAAIDAAATTTNIARRMARQCFLGRCLSFIGVRSTAALAKRRPRAP